MPHELSVFFAAMTPLLNLKLAIPLGMKLGLSNVSTLIFAIMGTIVPAAIILAIIEPVSLFSRRKSQLIDKFFQKLFHTTHKQNSKLFKRFGALIIILVVAIPLPGFGSVEGAVIAFIFGVEYWKALSFITLGVVISALLITGGAESITALLPHFNNMASVLHGAK